MTVWSQNGLSANDPSLIQSVIIPGTDVRVAVRKGPVGDLLLYAAARWHVEVEPLRAPDGVLDCWGYAARNVRGSNDISNHASGSALDLRARAHPLGTDPADNFTPAQISAIRKIVADCSGCLRWGGDYFGRKDGMHIETLGTEEAIATTLAHLMTVPPDPGGTDDMALNEHDIQTLIARLLATPLPDLYPSGPPTRTMTLADVLCWAAANAGRAEFQAQTANDKLDAVRADLDALSRQLTSLPNRLGTPPTGG